MEIYRDSAIPPVSPKYPWLESDADDESRQLNLPPHVLEMLIMEFCAGVDYLNLRSTCKGCHLAAPLMAWNNRKTSKIMQKYSLPSPWLIVFNKHKGIVTLTDPMFGNEYFMKTPQELICKFYIKCSRGDNKLVRDVAQAPASCCTSFQQYFHLECDEHSLRVIVGKFGESVELDVVDKYLKSLRDVLLQNCRKMSTEEKKALMTVLLIRVHNIRASRCLLKVFVKVILTGLDVVDKHLKSLRDVLLQNCSTGSCRLVPTLTARITDEIYQNENNGNNGFLEAKAGTQEEQAKHFKWGLNDFVVDKILNTEFTDVAQRAYDQRDSDRYGNGGRYGNRDMYGNNRGRSDRQGSDKHGNGSDKQGTSTQRMWRDHDQQERRVTGLLVLALNVEE
nr:Toll/interleukin-1 receptor (TIR) domain-containing protein [Tanacetum cinerariifolium]